jgi:hypothetical protein
MKANARKNEYLLIMRGEAKTGRAVVYCVLLSVALLLVYLL